MLGDINYNLKPTRPKIFLCKPNGDIVSKISEAYNINRKTALTELFSFSFNMPYYIEENNELARNRNIDLIKERFYIKLEIGSKIEWYIITKIIDSMSDQEDHKSIECIFLPQELADKTIASYSEESKNARQVLRDILSLQTSWSIGSIDPDFELTYRSWEFPGNSLLDAIFQVMERYNAIIEWNTENRTFDMVKPEFHGQNRLGTISHRKYLKTLNRETNAEQVVTRLIPKGKDGLGINRLTLNGSNYLEDFTYWMYPFERDSNRNVIKRSNYMSDSLCHALLDYQEKAKLYENEYQKLLEQLKDLTSLHSQKKVELNHLKNQLVSITQLQLTQQFDGHMFFEKTTYEGYTKSISFNIDSLYLYAVLIKIGDAAGKTVTINGQNGMLHSGQWIVSRKINAGVSNINVVISGAGTTDLFIQVARINKSEFDTSNNSYPIVQKYNFDNKEMEIAAKETEINAVQNALNSTSTQMANINTELSASKNFTQAQIKELDKYVVVQYFSDDTLFDDEDLFKEAKKKFDEIKIPQLSLKISIENFLNIIEEQGNWDKLLLGDKVIIKYEKFDLKIEAKIIEIEYDYENDEINLTIANFKNLNTNQEKLDKYIYNSNKATTIINDNKHKWDQAIVDVSETSKIFDNMWDKLTNQINMAANQTVIIDDKGITIVDHKDPLRFLRATNGVIGLTKSGGLRYETAISPDGVIAEQVLGKLILGQRVTIGDVDGIWMTEGPQTTITDRCGREVMKLGLYETNPDLFGMVINRYNDVIPCSTELLNRIIANSEDGFKIQQWNGTRFVDKFYADNNGLLFAEDMSTKRLKILSDTNELMLDSYTKYMDIGKFESIITDGKLTAIEKLQVLGERTRIISEYEKLLTQANTYKTTTRDSTIRINTTSFTNSYHALMNYLSPLLTNMDETSEIDRDEFINKFKAYYDEVTNIINAINDSIKYSSVQFGSHFNNVVIDYVNGVVSTRSDNKFRSIMNGTRGFIIQRNDGTAQNPIWTDIFYADNNGQLMAQDMTAKSLKIVSESNDLLLDGNTKYMDIGKFQSIIVDGKLTAIEKLQVLGERTRIVSEYTKLLTQANTYKTSDRDNSILINTANFTQAYEALINYLAPLLSNMSETSTIDRNEFINRFKAYYDEATNIINAISDSLKYSSVQFGSFFNNVVIDYLQGVVATRNDNMFRSIMNGTQGFLIERNIGTSANPRWQRVFWADTNGIVRAQGLRIAEGFLSDGGIENSYLVLRDGFGGVGKWYPSLGIWMGSEQPESAPFWVTPNGKLKLFGKAGELFIDTEAGVMNLNNIDIVGAGTIQGNQLVVNTLIAGEAVINDLTVNHLKTMKKEPQVGEYVDYIDIENNFLKFITASVSSKTQAKDDKGRLIYWTDSSKKYQTFEVTSYPFYEYSVTDVKVKAEYTFEGSGDTAYPVIKLGAGSPAEGMPNREKAVITKYNGGYKTEYRSSAYNRERSLDLSDDGIFLHSENSAISSIAKNLEFSITEGGDLSIANTSGTKIVIDSSGNISLESSRNINLKANGTINFNATSYNFN